ncbi:unnamed protein product [Nezara viridula]|uniref:Neuropeptide n=1 Tax=Nezara viridula TaxID=85310 RepID=A0A9P0HQ61_NEZVI|nr:unnamed protein product [Nezara viridula]
MKLVLFICLVGACLVAAEEEVSEKCFLHCLFVDCYNCYYSLHDCNYCCRFVPIDCALINCSECDIKYCGHCCGLAKDSETVS